MDWLSLIINAVVTLLGIGGISWIFTVRQDRRSKDLDNKAKENEIESNKATEILEGWKEIAEERRQRADKLLADNEAIQEKSRKKDAIITDLRKQIDDLNTYAARLEIFKCGILSCAKRVPKISDEVFTKTNIDTTKKIEVVETPATE